MKNLILIIVALTLTLGGFSQVKMKTLFWSKSEVDSLLAAQMMIEDQNFIIALPVYKKLLFHHPNELYLKYMVGICGLYSNEMHVKSLEYLKEVYEKNNRAADIEFYLARSYHLNYMFDDALVLLDKYLRKKNLVKGHKAEGRQLIDYCKNAKGQVENPLDIKIENMGNIVNTANSEYAPLVSSDESVMIFTYRGIESTGGLQNIYNEPDPNGMGYEDVFITHKENGQWIKPMNIGKNINTDANESAIAISNDGQKLFIFKDDGINGGGIYISKLDGTNWSIPRELKGDINTSYWEGSVSLSADEKTIYFSSERPGGYGGKDIYKATLQPDATWKNVSNLGATINTPFDDDAPFIHPDGRTLIYSSKGLNSMGGYDIFISRLTTLDSSWSKPENIGYPINTPDDDIYFVLSADGKHGYYSSGKSGGYGLQDIYRVEMPEDFKKPVIALVKGVATLDDKPVSATFQLYKMNQDETCSNVQSNSCSGNYLVNMEPGCTYKLTCKLDGFPDQVQNVDATNITSYMEKNMDIKFSTKMNMPKGSSPVVMNKDSIIGQIIHKYGNTRDESLEFKVQIPTHKIFKRYHYRHLKDFGKIEKFVLRDGISRVAIGGSFKTLNEASEYKKQLISLGQTDAVVTVVYQNIFIHLEELEQLGLLASQEK